MKELDVPPGRPRIAENCIEALDGESAERRRRKAMGPKPAPAGQDRQAAEDAKP